MDTVGATRFTQLLIDIEIFRNDILVVKVAVTPDVDKAKTHSEFMQSYEFDFCCQNLKGRLLKSCDGDLLD